MVKGARLERTTDHKMFEVTDLAHWSTIEADADGEQDTVKWIGGDEFVSASKGHSYRLLPGF